MSSPTTFNFDIGIKPVIVNCPPCKYGFCDMKTSRCICESGYHGTTCDEKRVNIGLYSTFFFGFLVVVILAIIYLIISWLTNSEKQRSKPVTPKPATGNITPAPAPKKRTVYEGQYNDDDDSEALGIAGQKMQSNF